MPSNERTPNPVAESGVQTNEVDTSTYLTFDGVHERAWLQVAATRYARHGFPVGPLRGKVPLTAHGMKDFTTDLEQVRGWWEQQQPGANIGVRPPANWVVLDIDPRNGGDATWKQINHGHTLPATIVTLTGSGGWHWWFQLPYAGEIRGSAGEGIDVKTKRGYLVMPPSIHPVTGGRYLLQQWVDPHLVPQLPVWLRKHVYRPLAAPPAARRVGGNDGTGLVGAVESVGQGQRNSTLYWAACRALEEGLNLEEELMNAARGVGLEDPEISATLTSARRTAEGAAA